ncbi:MAG: hypothetical protein B6D79_10105 [gamma proteobacterium symbiont of Ctena orbiculata]|nr:MAG: hypothetical protein B6D79_10105 [gamma proteobacterium symbiont of Ctena orbiculata]
MGSVCIGRYLRWSKRFTLNLLCWFGVTSAPYSKVGVFSPDFAMQLAAFGGEVSAAYTLMGLLLSTRDL